MDDDDDDDDTFMALVFLEKLIVTQRVSKFPAFTNHEGSMSCSQKPTIGPYHKSTL
jgi:hypothetical protein